MAEGGREGNLQVGDGGISNTVEVRGFSKKTSQELMEMYFENSRRSGGGDLEEVKIRDEVAYITFKEAEVAQKVASRSNHQVDGHTLTVTLFHPLPPKPCYQNRVLIQGVNNAITEELLRNFLETKTKAQVTEFLYGEEDGNVVVTLSDNIDIVQLGKIFQESSIQGVFLKAVRVAISNCILVQNIHPSTSHDVILYYFENKRRSGGGDVERVEMKTEERYCLTYFEDPSVIDRVLGQSHNVDGVDFEIHLHHECLGRRSLKKKSDLYLRMSSSGNKDSATHEDENADNQANDETSSSVSSNPENESDFVEVQNWQANDGIEPVLKLFIKYLKKQGKKTEADLSKHTVQCSMNLQLMWNFFMLTDCGKKMLDVIAANHHCKVSADDNFKEFFIFQVLNRQFHDESDVKNFVDEVLHNIEICAKESLCIDTIAIDPKIQDEVRERIKDGQELANVWVEFVGEDNPVTVYTVCSKDQQQLVLQIITDVITDATKSFNSHNEMVMADFMWQIVMTRLEYLKEFGLKFPSTEIIQGKNKNAFLLKGPRDEVKAVAGHLEELLKMAHKEVHEKVFSSGYQFEIFTSSEMCDYIDKSLPKLPVIWIPNHLTKEIHLFSKDPELLKGMDKSIRGCIEERLYPLSKKHSELSSEQIQLLKELMKKHEGKVVINLSQSPTGLLLTTADDIFKDVYAAVQTIISSEINEVHLETFVPEKLDGKDEQPGIKSQISNPGTEMKYLSAEKVSDVVQKITKALEVKDENIFRKLIIMEHMEKINQIAKEHSVDIKVCETQSKVGFVLYGLEKDVHFIYNAIKLQEQKFQQDISVIADATGKVHKQMLPNSDAAGKSGGSEMSEVRVATRPRSTHLSFRQQLSRTPGSLLVMNLKHSQVDILKAEIVTTQGLIVRIPKQHFQSGLALVECFGTIWIAGWDLKKYARLFDKFHIGDQLVAIQDVQVSDLSFVQKVVKNCQSETMEVTVRRLPHAQVFAIRRNAEGENIGIKRDNGTAEILYVDPLGLAAKHGLPSKARMVENDGTCSWMLTQINMRPLNLFFKDAEIEHLLSAVGLDISIVVQPSDFIKELKKQLMKIKGYKDFLVK